MGSLVPDAGGPWQSIWTETSKKNKKIYFDREVTPGFPSLQKPNIKVGGLTKNTRPLNPKPAWGGFGVLDTFPLSTQRSACI